MSKTLRLVVMLCLAAALLLGALPAASAEEPLRFSMRNWLKADVTDTLARVSWQEAMEAYMGREVEIDWKPVDYDSRLEADKLYLAAGKFEDVFVAQPGDQEIINQLGEAGLLVNIMDYEDLLVYYKPWLEDNNNAARVMTSDGKMYGFALGEYGTHTGNQQLFIYREDAFVEHGIKIPETQEEFYEAAKAFKELYPNSFPVGGGRGRGTNYDGYLVWLQINHTWYTMYYNGEEFIYGPAQDTEAWKATIEFLSKMYAEGLIDPELLTQSNDQCTERMLGDYHFMVPSYFAGEQAQLNNSESHPDVTWAFAPRPLSYDGRVGWKPSSLMPTYKLTPGDMNVISTKAKDIEAIVKFIDYQYSPEIMDILNWGVEGVTYTVDENGKKSFIDEIRNALQPRKAAEAYGLSVSSSSFPALREVKERNAWSGVFPSIRVYANGEYFDYDDMWKFSYDYEHQEESVFPNEIAPPIQYTEDERDFRIEVLTALDTYVKEGFMQFITGGKPIEEFEAWQQTLINVGDYETLAAMMNEKLEAFR